MKRFDPMAPDAREQLIGRAKVLRAEIEQIFTDAASWNENTRKPDEEPIDPDPDGAMRRIADGLDRMLANESKGGLCR